MTYVQSVLDVVYAFPCYFFYALACLFLGARLMVFLKIYPENGMPLSRIGYLGGAFFIGQGIFGALWQTIATLGFFSSAVVISILGAVVLSGITQFPSLFKLALGGFKSLRRDTWSLGIFWIIIALLLILLIFLFAVITVIPVGWDAVSYYAAQSKLIAITHRLTPLTSYEPLAECGLNAEMHAAVMFLLGDDIIGQYASQMTVWITALASAAIIWAISAQVGLSRVGQWITLVMLYTSTAFTFMMCGSDLGGFGSGKTDLYGAGLGLAAVYWLLQIGKLPNWVPLFLSGLMAGFAINSKLSLVVVMIPMLGVLSIFYLWSTLDSKNAKENLPLIFKIHFFVKAALISGGSILIAFLPLIFKNTIVFHDPFVPFLSFHHSQSILLTQTWYSPENTRWIILTYPLILIMGLHPTQFGTLSALLLAFLPLCILFPKYLGVFKNKPLKLLTLSSIVGIASWVLFYPSTLAVRYFLTPLLTLLPAGGYVAEQIWRQRGNLILRVVMGCSIIIMLWWTISSLEVPLHKAHTYWSNPRNIQEGLWQSLSLVNTKAKKGDRVFLAMYPRFALRSDLLQSLSCSHPILDPTKPFFTWKDIYLDGCFWVVVDRITHGKIKVYGSLVNVEDVPDFLTIITHPIDDRYVVYQIIPKEGAPKPLKAAVEQKDGTWKVQDFNN